MFIKNVCLTWILKHLDGFLYSMISMPHINVCFFLVWLAGLTGAGCSHVSTNWWDITRVLGYSYDVTNPCPKPYTHTHIPRWRYVWYFIWMEVRMFPGNCCYKNPTCSLTCWNNQIHHMPVNSSIGIFQNDPHDLIQEINREWQTFPETVQKKNRNDMTPTQNNTQISGHIPQNY